MNASALFVVVALFVLSCSAGVLSVPGCPYPVTDWNLQGSPQPCSCDAKVFLLSQNSITVAFKTRVYATKVKIFFAPENSYATPTTTTPSTTFPSSSFTTTGSSFTTTGSSFTTDSTTTFSNIFGRGDSGIIQVRLIGSNDQSAVIFDSSAISGPIFDGSSGDCFTLTITPPPLPFRVQKVELSSTDSNDLPVRGVKLFGLTDQPAPSTQRPGYVAAPDGSLLR